ncbi:MAG: hypothetical protein ACR2MG_04810 [Pyrinomonadaceae bacterium]
MSKPWISSVKDTGKLKIYNELAGKWKIIFHLALESFKTLGLSVNIEKTVNKEQANVLMRLANKVAKYDYDEQSFTQPFSGTALHGLTMQLSRDGEIEKAVIFLPETPQTSVGYIRGKLVVESVSQDIMLGIAVHELIHACGLENSDHADNGIFYFPLAISGKKLIVPEKDKNNKPMPPFFLSPITISKVQSLWN